jgi:hypothetical protein
LGCEAKCGRCARSIVAVVDEHHTAMRECGGGDCEDCRVDDCEDCRVDEMAA